MPMSLPLPFPFSALVCWLFRSPVQTQAQTEVSQLFRSPVQAQSQTSTEKHRTEANMHRFMRPTHHTSRIATIYAFIVAHQLSLDAQLSVLMENFSELNLSILLVVFWNIAWCRIGRAVDAWHDHSDGTDVRTVSLHDRQPCEKSEPAVVDVNRAP